MHLILKIAAAAATVTAIDLALAEETGLSLLQLRAHKVNTTDLPPKGYDLIKRSIVGDVGSVTMIDLGAGPFEENGKLASVKFYAGRAGNRGLRFRIFRPRPGVPRNANGELQAYDYIAQTEMLEDITVGLNEKVFSVQVPFLKGDFIGWVHPWHGNINYGPGVNANAPAGNELWYASGVGSEENCLQIDNWNSAYRVYSYQVTTVPSTAADYSGEDGDVLCGADLPEGMADDAAAVGDPHLTSNTGKTFDMTMPQDEDE